MRNVILGAGIFFAFASGSLAFEKEPICKLEVVETAIRNVQKLVANNDKLSGELQFVNWYYPLGIHIKPNQEFSILSDSVKRLESNPYLEIKTNIPSLDNLIVQSYKRSTNEKINEKSINFAFKNATEIMLKIFDSKK